MVCGLEEKRKELHEQLESSKAQGVYLTEKLTGWHMLLIRQLIQIYNIIDSSNDTIVLTYLIKLRSDAMVMEKPWSVMDQVYGRTSVGQQIKSDRSYLQRGALNECKFSCGHCAVQAILNLDVFNYL